MILFKYNLLGGKNFSSNNITNLLKVTRTKVGMRIKHCAYYLFTLHWARSTQRMISTGLSLANS